jgi:hypothetical protein
VHDVGDDATILAALQLSAEKWGAFQVTGSEAYKARCARLAARYRRHPPGTAGSDTPRNGPFGRTARLDRRTDRATG